MQNLVISAVILGLLATALAVYKFFAIRKLNRLRATFFAGRDGADLEGTLNSLASELRSLKREQTALEHTIASVKEKLNFAIQRIGMIKFNPFQDAGGNLSFSLALLDAHGNGVVVTSMHGREQNRIYLKKIQGNNCEIRLTEEERQAILMANQKPKNVSVPQN